MKDGDAERGRQLLAERVRAIPDALSKVEVGPPLGGEGAVVTTAAGGSEGPARILAAALAAAGRHARFEPLSAFARASDVAALRPAECHLVLVSQGLSPNACLALEQGPRFRSLSVLTSVRSSAAAPANSPEARLARAAASGARVVWHGPDAEHGLLVRVLGPTCATLAALRLAGLEPPIDLAERYRVAFARADERLAALAPLTSGARSTAEQPLALVTAGASAPLAHGLRWKLLEACGIADPPVWDVLQFAHGPFQQIYERPMTVAALERPGDDALIDRLAAVLVADRHRLFRSTATLPAPWSFFEHDAELNAFVLAWLAERPIDLTRWPGQGADGPLYELGRE